jgi:predicted dithiol-disulfide oxidoreductase (DUF899 family)
MAKPQIVSAAERQRARDELLVPEKEATRTLDDIAARRPVLVNCDLLMCGEAKTR